MNLDEPISECSTNYLTFHRLKTFRTLTRANDAAPFADN